MSKKMCEVCGKNPAEVPDREEIRPVIAAASDMMEALEGAKWLIECYVAKPERYEEYQDVMKAIQKARGVTE